jgi:ABC-type glycerol-3-phosphate transport system substrate-binding protein
MGLPVTDVQKALKGADYPATRDDLVSLAERNRADGEVVDALRGMDGDSFDSPAEVMKGLGGALGSD